MFNENLANKLSMFNLVHLITLGVCITIIILAFIFRERIANKKFEKVFRITMASILIVLEASFHIWLITLKTYDIGMIPLTGFCATTNILTIITLLSNKPKYFNYIIYYAITGALLSLIFVDIEYTFPHFRFIHYFTVHFGFLLVSLYYFFTKHLNINLKNVLLTASIIFIQAIILLVLDLIFDKNWFYLIANPLESISDALGLPLYTILWILSVMGMIALWFIILRFIQQKFLIKK